MIMLRELNNKLEHLLGSTTIHTNYLGVDLSENDAATRRNAYRYRANMLFTTPHPTFGKQAYIMHGSDDVYKPVIMPVTNTDIFFEIKENDNSVASIFSGDTIDKFTFSSDATTFTFRTSYKRDRTQYMGILTALNVENKGNLKR
jgi:hypothetical protein